MLAVVALRTPLPATGLVVLAVSLDRDALWRLGVRAWYRVIPQAPQGACTRRVYTISCRVVLV